MSFIITVYVREGIVMASDSRMTLNAQQEINGQAISHLAVGQTDSSYKTFLASNNIGISTCGDAAVKGIPITGHIESFINERLTRPRGPGLQIDDVPQLLMDYFHSQGEVPATQFHVAGYKRQDSVPVQRVWNVDVAAAQAQLLNENQVHGVSWSGEGDIIARLITPVAQVGPAGETAPFPYYPIPWEFFTLQDAIDFAVYAVRSTSDAIRFMPRPKTVGGPIDVLVIKPDKSQFIQRKELQVTL